MIGPIPDKHSLGRLSSAEIGELDGEQVLVVLPVASVEQHGPHLPVLTDSLIGQAVLARALALRRDDERVWTLPLLPYGKSNEHVGFPGTFGVNGETLARVLRDIGRWTFASGLRRLLLLNSHGGNQEILDYVARDLREEVPLLCLTAHPFRFSLERGVISEREGEYGLHAGESETSIILALAPELVHVESYAAGLPPQRERLSQFGLVGPARFAWLTRDISTSGTIGDPSAASAEKGEAILEAQARLLADLMDEALGLPLPPS